MKRKKRKGEYGYLSWMRIREGIKTLLYFAVSLLLYYGGILATGNNKNALTIVAVLGMLPAGKSMVSFLMYCRAKGCSEETFQNIRKTLSERGKYDLYFTTYENNYPCSHTVFTADGLYLLLENRPELSKSLEEHLDTMILKNGFGHIKITVFTSVMDYLEALEKTHIEEREEVLHLLENLSL